MSFKKQVILRNEVGGEVGRVTINFSDRKLFTRFRVVEDWMRATEKKLGDLGFFPNGEPADPLFASRVDEAKRELYAGLDSWLGCDSEHDIFGILSPFAHAPGGDPWFYSAVQQILAEMEQYASTTLHGRGKSKRKGGRRK